MIISKKDFEELRSKMDLSNLYYPSAKDWMWDYCLYLRSFTDSEGINYDLGVHRNFTDSVSLAIVYEDEKGKYISGKLDLNKCTLDYEIQLLSILNKYPQFTSKPYVLKHSTEKHKWVDFYCEKPTIRQISSSINHRFFNPLPEVNPYQAQVLLSTSKCLNYTLTQYDCTKNEHEDILFEFSITIVNHKYNNSIEHRALVQALKSVVNYYTSIQALPVTKQILCSNIQRFCKMYIEMELNINTTDINEALKTSLGIDSYMYIISEDQVYINDEPLVENFDSFLVNQWIIDSKSQSVIFKPLPINWIKLFNNNIRPKRWSIYKHKLIKQKL